MSLSKYSDHSESIIDLDGQGNRAVIELAGLRYKRMGKVFCSPYNAPFVGTIICVHPIKFPATLARLRH